PRLPQVRKARPAPRPSLRSSPARRRNHENSPAFATTRWHPVTPSRSQAYISRRTTSLPRSRVAARVLSMRHGSCGRAKRTTRKNGSRQSRRTPLARALAHMITLTAALLALPLAVSAQALAPYKIVGDGIPDPLTGAPGDTARGRALVVDRTSTCI